MACDLRFAVLTTYVLVLLLIGSSAQNYGRSFDSCREDSDCSSSLKCNVLEGSFPSIELSPCTEDEIVCLCTPKTMLEFKVCTSSSNCPRLERCASIADTPVNVCVSCSIRADLANEDGVGIEFVDDSGSNCPTPSPSSPALPTNTPSMVPVLSPPSSPSASVTASPSSIPSIRPSEVSLSPSPSAIFGSQDLFTVTPSILESLPASTQTFATSTPETSFMPSSSIDFTRTPTPMSSAESSLGVISLPPLESPPILSGTPLSDPVVSRTPDADMSETAIPSKMEVPDLSDSPSISESPEISMTFAPAPTDLSPSMTPDSSSSEDQPASSSPDPTEDANPSASVSASVSVSPSVSASVNASASASASSSFTGAATEGNESPTPTISGEAEGESDGICVDVSLLAQVAQKDRVFSKDRRASVLCDESGTCATSGHMVVWRGTPMSMKDYCSNFSSSCTAQVRWVNSPRYSRGLRLPSRTDGLQLTPLAAKWNTRSERFILGIAVRMGL